MAAHPEGFGCGPDGFPWVRDVNDERVCASLWNVDSSVAHLEFDSPSQPGRANIVASDVNKVLPQVVGHDTTLRADGVGQREAQGA